MTLDKILAITNKPGLFKLVNPSRSGYIVESLLDNKRTFIKIDKTQSLLSDISMYTLEGEVPLSDVFDKIFNKENGNETSISPNASKDDLEEYLFSILPNYDEDRVYPSDIKKLLRWYNLLLSVGGFGGQKTSKDEEE
ncbi:DUF5606 domain-containing protein [Flavobacteriaceae bacterium]|jgi:hypothetical protein|nr:DUF5606 domain-containing protein [Flavobacteriaceae bacterium]MDC0571322.1 DUF5606 domain-containing protein [Flavobacteriaceae bacterium]|tara:strand:- start:5719 stop:6132 length:414 start_codon:yes stop_codon:yes gene_type:complete